jgi:dihydrofolate reductase
VTALVLVAAVAENGVIGAKGGLPWRVKADLQRFRIVTMGKPMIMGRKTFISIGRVLDGRDSIVITRDQSFRADGLYIAHSIEESLRLGQARAEARGVQEVCVIGGAEIFDMTLPRAGQLDITHILARPEGDVFFPPIDPAIWMETSRTDLLQADGDTARAVNAIYQRRS